MKIDAEVLRTAELRAQALVGQPRTLQLQTIYRTGVPEARSRIRQPGRLSDADVLAIAREAFVVEEAMQREWIRQRPALMVAT